MDDASNQAVDKTVTSKNGAVKQNSVHSSSNAQTPLAPVSSEIGTPKFIGNKKPGTDASVQTLLSMLTGSLCTPADIARLQSKVLTGTDAGQTSWVKNRLHESVRRADVPGGSVHKSKTGQTNGNNRVRDGKRRDLENEGSDSGSGGVAKENQQENFNANSAEEDVECRDKKTGESHGETETGRGEDVGERENVHVHDAQKENHHEVMMESMLVSVADAHGQGVAIEGNDTPLPGTNLSEEQSGLDVRDRGSESDSEGSGEHGVRGDASSDDDDLSHPDEKQSGEGTQGGGPERQDHDSVSEQSGVKGDEDAARVLADGHPGEEQDDVTNAGALLWMSGHERRRGKKREPGAGKGREEASSSSSRRRLGTWETDVGGQNADERGRGGVDLFMKEIYRSVPCLRMFSCMASFIHGRMNVIIEVANVPVCM